MADVVVDTKGIAELAREIEEAQRVLLGRLAERGYQLLRAEVPIDTTNLQQGVASPGVSLVGRHVTESENKQGETVIDNDAMTATLTVSARSARNGAGSATLFGADGKQKKTVSLRPQKAFNYAEAVAKGRPAISPKRGKVLIIPVASAPSGESYLLIGGKVYVFRRSAKAVQPNAFDERAATRLEAAAQNIADGVLREIFK